MIFARDCWSGRGSARHTRWEEAFVKRGADVPCTVKNRCTLRFYFRLCAMSRATARAGERCSRSRGEMFRTIAAAATVFERHLGVCAVDTHREK